ncbi:carbohydrate ABC transporter membrane protein 2 (CUT1 family) [Knoellia remsis]|uniref:Carbohydrate ABC transporter membrane protein 2 (CUT1 family) n=1 Tax=Knoellia remsis TaxID=407159 RepID=A0A2T0U4R4_9MICO|nr:carbohydrate ABC transporter permease [Knoellia remsis]PRY52890.1 carbohydrate ABC transporter membrane protein 2 (CUT1 family) [Knoellia remsis]
MKRPDTNTESVGTSGTSVDSVTSVDGGRRRGGRTGSRRGGGNLVTYLILGVLFLVVLFPVYYGLVGSFMGERDTNSFPPALWPQNGIYPENYSNALGIIPLGSQYLTSVLQTLGITAGQMVTSALAAYAFVFLSLKWRAFWFGVFLSTMMIPYESIIIPNYLLISQWGLKDTIAGLVLPFLATGFGTFLLRQSFLSFPMELRDAARVDGAGHLRFLFSILLPLSRPSLAALGIWSALSAWNMYFWPLLATEDPRNQTIQIGISQLQSSDSDSPGMVLAGVMLALFPTLLLVIFGQRFIVRGLTAGAVK